MLASNKFSWKGLLKTAEDNFDSGSDQDLTSAGWTKIIGTASIREDGTSKAYSTSAGFGSSASYKIDMFPTGSLNRLKHRWVRCTFDSLAGNTTMGVYFSVTYSGSNRTAIWVDVIKDVATGIWSFTFNQQFNGGPISGQLIGTITEGVNPLPYMVLMRSHGSLIDIDIGTGTITGGDGLISLYNQTMIGQNLSNSVGLLYVGPAFSLGGKNAEWSKFEVRIYS